MVNNSDVKTLKKRITELEDQLTGQQQYERKLKTSEASFQSVIDNIPDIVYSLDQNTNILNVNIPSASKFGYTSDEILGKNFSDFIHPDDRERVAASFIEAIETQRKWTRGLQLRLIAKDGTVHWMEANAHMQFNKDGQYLREDGVVRNIDEQKKMEEMLLMHQENLKKSIEEKTSELRAKNDALQKEIKEKERIASALGESEHKYRQLFKYAPSAILEVDFSTWRLTKVNEVACNFLGYSRKELLSINITDLLTENSKKVLFERFGQVPDGKNIPTTVEYQIKKKDGSLMWIHLNANTYVKNNKQLFASVVATDISERKKLEEALHVKDLAVASSNHGIGIGDLEGKVVYLNAAALRMMGVSELSEVVGRPVLDYAVSQDEVAFVMQEVLEKGSWEGEIKVKKLDGSIRVLQLSANIVFDDNGKPTCTMDSFIDITLRKDIEDDLIKSKEKYKALYSMMRLMCDNVPDMIWSKDLNQHYTFANKAMCKKLLITDHTDEPMGKDDMHFALRERKKYPENPHWHDFGEICKNTDSIVMETGKAHRFDEYGNVQGKLLFLDVFKAPFFDDQGQMIGTVGCGRDVTREKKLEEERLQVEANVISAQKKLQAMIDSSEDLISLKDPEFRYLVANKAHEKAFNIKIKSIIGKTDDEFIQPALAKQCLESDQKALEDGRIAIEEEFDDRFYNVVKQRVTDGDGKIIGVAGVIRDITNWRRSENDKINLEKQLRQSQKMEAVGTLAGGIAHDFNNILTAIIGFTEVTLEDVESESDFEYALREVLSAGHRAKDLVKQILTFARQTEHELKPVRVDILFKEAAKLIRSTTPATINIVSRINSKSLIMADPTQIHQIIMNLCTNAAQAMEEEGGKMVISLLDESINAQMPIVSNDLEPGNYIKIVVEDTGSGILPKNMESIFEPYFSTKKAREGTGLGLAVVHGIVKSYKGEIVVTSKPGCGSVFTIYLPVIRQARFENESKAKAIPKGNERILFIDDEEPIIALGCMLLEPLGYRVTTRTSGLEALELFRHKKDAFDLVITDMTMPDMTGDRLAVKLLEIRPDVPIILCTGYSKKIPLDKFEGIGVSSLIMKPLVKRKIATTIRKVLDDAK